MRERKPHPYTSISDSSWATSFEEVCPPSQSRVSQHSYMDVCTGSYTEPEEYSTKGYEVAVPGEKPRNGGKLYKVMEGNNVDENYDDVAVPAQYSNVQEEETVPVPHYNNRPIKEDVTFPAANYCNIKDNETLPATLNGSDGGGGDEMQENCKMLVMKYLNKKRRSSI